MACGAAGRGDATSLADPASSTESFVSGAMVVSGSTPSPKKLVKTPVKHGFSKAMPNCGMVLQYCGWTFCAQGYCDQDMRRKTEVRVGNNFSGFRLFSSQKIPRYVRFIAQRQIIIAQSCGVQSLLCRLWPFAILLVEIRMAVGQAGQLPFDEKIFHLGLNFEWIAIGHDHVA